MKFKKSDLQYDYRWTTTDGDDPKITGKADSVFLNRGEGYEVLPFINTFLGNNDLDTKEDGLKVEKMIKEDLPSDIRSRENVAEWLLDNWEE